MWNSVRRFVGRSDATQVLPKQTGLPPEANGAGDAWTTATAFAGAAAERATHAAAHAAGAAKAVAAVPKDFVAGVVRKGVEGATRRLRALVEKIVQIASFVSAAVSMIFVGLFMNIGFEMSTLVDRASMLSSIALLTCVFTSIRVVLGVLPALLAEPEAASIAASGRRFRIRALLQTTASGIAGAAFVVTLVGFSYGVALLVVILAGWIVFRRRNLTSQLSAALIACLCLGYLRGEHLRDQSPSLMLVEQGRAEPIAVTVIMSADRGVLVFADRAESARFVPWDRIETLTDPRARRWRLRDALAQVRTWLEGRMLSN